MSVIILGASISAQTLSNYCKIPKADLFNALIPSKVNKVNSFFILYTAVKHMEVEFS